MTSTDPFQAVVFGGGAMATDFHVPRLLRLLHAARIDLVEVNPARREILAERYVRDKEVVVVDKLPEHPIRYQLAVVAVPPAYHASVVASCAGRAEIILVEKPICLTMREGQELIETCRGRGSEVRVCLPRRALSHLSVLRRHLRSGAFGALQKVTINEGRPFAWNAASYSYFDKRQSGGGVLMDLGPHILDQLFQVFDELAFVQSEVDCEPGAIEANCRLQLQADRAFPVSVCLSRNRYLSNTIAFLFSGCRCVASLHEESVLVYPDQSPTYKIGPILGTFGFESALDRLYTQFLFSSEMGELTPECSLRGIQLIEQAYAESSRLDMEVHF